MNEKISQNNKLKRVITVFAVVIVIAVAVFCVMHFRFHDNADEMAVEFCNAMYSGNYPDFEKNLLPELYDTISEETKEQTKEEFAQIATILESQNIKTTCAFDSREKLTKEELETINKDFKENGVSFEAKAGVKVKLIITAEVDEKAEDSEFYVHFVRRGNRYYISDLDV